MIEEISANLFKIEIPIPLPDSPLKSVNSYVIKGAERALIVDTGMDREECLKEMQAGLTELGIDLKKTDFFITHMHADHLGLVLSLLEDGAKIYFNRKDGEGIDFFNRHRDSFVHFAIRNGFPENEVQMLLQNHPGYKYRLRGEFAFTFLKEDQRLNVSDYFFRCVETPGHTRGHMCLYEKNRKILVAGDHILNGIIPNMQIWSDEWSPLKEYMKSLDKVYQLDIELVLPGHGSVFRNYKERIQELRHHHKKRLGDLSSVLGKKGLTAYQIASRMNWDGASGYDAWEKFPILQRWFATSEAIAHLKYLEEMRKIRRRTRGKKKVFSLNVRGNLT
jgi:glyoxylase-like metal-dependent hydrolase (beta-lactamase superfamily II)